MSASAAAGHDHHHEDDDRPFRPDYHTGDATPGKVGMWIFLLTDAFMFAGFLLTYGILRAGAPEGTWISEGEPTLGINFTAVLTFLLICSSVTMVLGLAASIERDRKKTLMFLALTAIGGMLFLAGQYQEYFGIVHHGLTEEGLHFGGSSYATTFYVVTGFHGMHVFTGVVLLWITFFKTAMSKKDPDTNFIEVVGLFWHFVDLIWILVFTFIYLL